jgi:predicted unusual protein kinase regulating ubiquinone biosynthesis (AarF/ABC1/UbiB family)
MDEENNLTSRLKRYVSVSTNLSVAAAQLAGGKFFGIPVDHPAMALKLATALGNLKGPVMKVAQMLGTIPDAVPDEYMQAFTELQSNAPSMGWSFVRRRMNTELGLSWESRFEDFSKGANAAASLGQVHKAVTKEGETVACKLQYPDMMSKVEADLAQLKIVLKLYESTIGALETEAAFEEITERLKEELDYEHESHNINTFRAVFDDHPYVHIPKVHPAYSTKRLLTLEWMEGRPLHAFKQESKEIRNLLAERMFNAWYYPFYHFGLIHGDPHLGNYTFRDDHTINLLDFGCVRVFSPTFVEGVIMLYEAVRDQNFVKSRDAYELWGFENLNKDVIDILNLWATLLYEPLIEDRIRPIQKDNRGHEGRERAYHIHEALRKLGGVRPPKEFVFMDRAAVGIGSVCMHLGAELNWHTLFHSLIHDFTPSRIEQNQKRLQVSSYL